jgi:hypothetical protein
MDRGDRRGSANLFDEPPHQAERYRLFSPLALKPLPLSLNDHGRHADIPGGVADRHSGCALAAEEGGLIAVGDQLRRKLKSPASTPALS